MEALPIDVGWNLLSQQSLYKCVGERITVSAQDVVVLRKLRFICMEYVIEESLGYQFNRNLRYSYTYFSAEVSTKIADRCRDFSGRSFKFSHINRFTKLCVRNILCTQKKLIIIKMDKIRSRTKIYDSLWSIQST